VRRSTVGSGEDVEMPILDDLRADLTTAMKERDQVRTSTLRLTLSAITAAETSGTNRGELDDAGVLAVIRAEVKKRNESAEIYAKAGRAEQADAEKAEAAVLSAYLPAQLDDDALAAIVADEIAAAGGAGDPKAKGKVIGAVRARVGDQADGGRIAAAVTAALGG
jgi:uncharacterized protein